VTTVADFGETVAIEPRHVAAVVKTLHDGGQFARSPEAFTAARDVCGRAVDQGLDAIAWLLPAEQLAQLAHHACAIEVYGLDEEVASTYDHPQVHAEHWIYHQVHQQAPRTAAAMEALFEAEAVVTLESLR